MSTKPKTEKSELKRNLMLVCIAAIIGIAVYFIEPWAAEKFHWNPMMRHQDIDTSKINNPIAEDSIKVYQGKVPYSNFMSDYSAEKLYSNFKSNSVVFNESYNGKHIDVAGIIKTISTSFLGYSTIELNTGDNSNGTIICNNIKHDRDAWKEEVKTVIVGDTVHIQGIYNKISLDQENMYLEHCHIIRN